MMVILSWLSWNSWTFTSALLWYISRSMWFTGSGVIPGQTTKSQKLIHWKRVWRLCGHILLLKGPIIPIMAVAIYCSYLYLCPFLAICLNKSSPMHQFRGICNLYMQISQSYLFSSAYNLKCTQGPEALIFWTNSMMSISLEIQALLTSDVSLFHLLSGSINAVTDQNNLPSKAINVSLVVT